jgi:hypothetical protein
MPFVDRTHNEFKWQGRDGGDSMSYMWQVNMQQYGRRCSADDDGNIFVIARIIIILMMRW